MNTRTQITIYAIFAAVLAIAACSGSKAGKLKGEWRSKDNETLLKITGKQFIMDNDSPVAEDYFVKEDTIFTSFQGNLPYTKFVVQSVDDHNLKLLYPDSVVVEFTK